MYLKEIYFSGGDTRELQEAFRLLPYNLKTVRGDILDEADTVDGLKVSCNPKKIDLTTLLEVLFSIVDPYLPDGQGLARGKKYRAGVWYNSSEDLPQLEYYMHFLANRDKHDLATNSMLTLNDPNSNPKARLKCHATLKKLSKFSELPETEQNYYQQHEKASTYIDFEKLKEYLKL